MTDKLNRARHYEALHLTPAEQRPVFHAVPPVGWCNDPNGFSWYKGEMHLFFQYYPYATCWGAMHWGHLTTKDLLHWQLQPCALAPDTVFDSEGCFSGGAIEWQGKHLLLYTGVQSKDDATVQQQCLAVGDGTEYVKSAANPVIPCEKQPAGASHKDFRDPGFLVQDGRLYAVVAGRSPNKHGRILLYQSKTPEKEPQQWEFVRTLVDNDGTLGGMWECPNLFELEGRAVLLISPQFMRTSLDGRYLCGNNALALVGHWAGPKDEFHREADLPLDYGLDFYAPQTIAMPDGRRVMIGWLQNWDHCYPPEGALWYGQMSLPRELFFEGDTLCQRPIRELDEVRHLRFVKNGIAVGEKALTLPQVRGRVLDLELTVYIGKAKSFALRFACGERHYTELRFDVAAHQLRVDRRLAGGVHAGLELREAPLCECGETLTLRLVLDRYSAECFVQGGRQTVSLTLYDTPQGADGIAFEADAPCTMDLQAYDMEL